MDGEGRQSFATLLRRFRRLARRTQEQLAELADISVAEIGLLEQGKHRWPYPRTVMKLADALGLAPADQALLLEAAKRPRLKKTPRPAVPGPIGREREWSWLLGEFDGRSPVLLLAGQPGIGKSHLLRAAASWASENEWHVLRGGCHRETGQEAYAPIAEAIEQSVRSLGSKERSAALEGCDWLAPLLPELADKLDLAPPAQVAIPGSERRLMFNAVERYLHNIAGPAGTLLVLDDLHWADTDAIQLLTRLARSGLGQGVRVLGAYRSHGAPQGHPLLAMIADLVRDDLISELRLNPLDEKAASALVTELLITHQPNTQKWLADDAVVRVVARGGGIPFYLVSCARDQQARESQGKQARSSDAAPWDVAQSVGERVAALPSAAQDLVRAAAVVGEPASCALLAEVVGLPEEQALRGLEAACRAALLVEVALGGGREAYRCAHDLVRDVVTEDLIGGWRTLLHRRVARALERRLNGQPSTREPLVTRLTYHYAHAGVPEKAAAYLRVAGDQARDMYAHAEAARYYQDLVARLDDLDRSLDAAVARRDLAAELAHLGRFPEALVALDRAEEAYRVVGDVNSQAHVIAAIASINATRGTGDAGLARLRPFVEAVTRPSASPDERNTIVAPGMSSWLLSTLSHLCFMCGHYEESLRTAERAVEVARTLADTTILARTRLALGVALLSLGRLDEASDQLERAITGAAADGKNPEGLGLLVETQLMATWTYQSAGDFARSRELVNQAMAVARELGNVVLLGHATFFRGLLDYYMGNWNAARAASEDSAKLLQDADSSQIGSYPPLGLGWLCLVQGRREEALRHLEQAQEIARHSEGDQVLRFVEEILAEEELVHGHAEAACAHLDPILEAGPLQERTRVEFLTLRAWATARMGDLTRASDLANEALRSAREHQMRLVLPDALRVSALCAIYRQEWIEAEVALNEALALCQEMPYPYAQAKVLYFSGFLQVRMRRPERARELFEQALAICSGLGERLYGAAIERALASTRVGVGARREDRPPR